MKAAILHLSDLHIESTNAKWLEDKTERIVSSIRNDFSGCDKIIVVVSGDVAFSGKKEQYDQAKRFFRSLLRCFAERPIYGAELENHIICVPGNHDCNFDQETGIRKITLPTVKNNVDAIDESVYDIASSIQEEYRDFVRYESREDVTVRFNDNVKIKVGDKTILFRLYNSAWMSTLKEEQNSIVMPMNLINQDSHDTDFVISVFHHYYSWMSPASDDSRNRFRKFIMKTSNMVLYGHEHVPGASHIKDNYEGECINEFEGGTLCSDYPGRQRVSSFNTLVIDFNSFECIVRSYNYEGGIYSKKKEESVHLVRERKMDEFRHNPDFLTSLKRMSIPIHNSENVRMTLDEFFVYPDLERINARQVRVEEDYVDSASLINDKKYELIVLGGDDQCGKSSLLKMFYLQFVDHYYYPILIDGKNIENENVDSIIKKAYVEQYNPEDSEKYSQYSGEKKILLLDNLDECQLNETAKKKLINQLIGQFAKVVITTKDNQNVSSSFFIMEKNNTFAARIKPLGHVKRNELVKKFYKTYNVNASRIQQQALLEQVKAGFDMVENFLGKEYIPSYPIYILSILLSNTKMQGSALEQTSYGYCYDALITCALLTCVDKAKLTGYYNILTHLAYFIYCNNLKDISEDQLSKFHQNYQEIYYSQGFKEIKANLLKCNLIRCNDDYYYKFSYNYIYYYLVAKYMADNLHSQEGQNDVLNLCVNIMSVH